MTDSNSGTVCRHCKRPKSEHDMAALFCRTRTVYQFEAEPAPAEQPRLDLDMEFAGKVKAIGEKYNWDLQAFFADYQRELDKPPVATSPAEGPRKVTWYAGHEVGCCMNFFPVGENCDCIPAAQSSPDAAKVSEIARQIQDEWTNGVSVTVEDAALLVLRPYFLQVSAPKITPPRYDEVAQEGFAKLDELAAGLAGEATRTQSLGDGE